MSAGRLAQGSGGERRAKRLLDADLELPIVFCFAAKGLHNRNGRAMNRSSIIALLILAAILGYFLSFGPESTRNLQSGAFGAINEIIAPRILRLGVKFQF